MNIGFKYNTQKKVDVLIIEDLEVCYYDTDPMRSIIFIKNLSDNYSDDELFKIIQSAHPIEYTHLAYLNI